MRLGIIGSSGGSALAAADCCLIASGYKINWTVVVDRQCGLASWALEQGHKTFFVDYETSGDFSSKASDIFDDSSCDNVLLFYTRRVAAPLIEKKQVFNIHPALLPSFRGLHGLKDAKKFGARIFGATLHRVDEGLDTGQILYQVAEALPQGISLSDAYHLSYRHKVWLTLAWVDYLLSPVSNFPFEIISNGNAIACPGLQRVVLREQYAKFLENAQKI